MLLNAVTSGVGFASHTWQALSILTWTWTPFPANKTCHLLDGLKVLWDEFIVGNLDSELLLDEFDQLQHSHGVQDAALQQGITLFDTPRASEGEFPDEEIQYQVAGVLSFLHRLSLTITIAIH